MDNGKILIVNVSKGRIGEDNSALLGAMLITKIQLAAMDRASIPEEERRDFYLYVDEFQNFATESFATILSEARKYHLNLTIAHQYITQMEEPVRDAVFGNVGTMIAFRVGAYDAEYLEKEYAPQYTETDLVNQDKYSAYVKLMINGITSKPFSMMTIPPTGKLYDTFDKVVAISRERYGNKREEVEEKIARWSGVVFQERAQEDNATQSQREPWQDQAKKRQENPPSRPPFEPKPAAQSQPRPQAAAVPKENELVDIALPKAKEEITDLSALLKKPEPRAVQAASAHAPLPRAAAPASGPRLVEQKPKEMFAAICTRCGKATEVPFKPDPEKPVYCAECFAIIKEERKQQQKNNPRPPQVKPLAQAAT
jgi:CxxC-x17-CxxC domain-containing protein